MMASSYMAFAPLTGSPAWLPWRADMRSWASMSGAQGWLAWMVGKGREGQEQRSKGKGEEEEVKLGGSGNGRGWVSRHCEAQCEVVQWPVRSKVARQKGISVTECRKAWRERGIASTEGREEEGMDLRS